MSVRHEPNDPMLRQGSDHCRCMECGEYFNSTYAFDLHRVGALPNKRCLSTLELGSGGWGRGPLGHWLSPQKGAGRAARAEREPQ